MEKRPSILPIVQALSANALAVLLLIAAIKKIIEPQSFVTATHEITKLPHSVVSAIGALVVGSEIVLGVMGLGRNQAAAVRISIFGLFSIFFAYQIWIGFHFGWSVKPPACACFGSSQPDWTQSWVALRNLGLICLSVIPLIKITSTERNSHANASSAVQAQ